MLSLFSSGSSPDERDGGGGVADGRARVVAAAAGRAGGRPHRLLQAAVRGGGQRRLGGDRGQAKPDQLRAGRAASLDRVPHMGPGRHQRRRRTRVISGHRPHA